MAPVAAVFLAAGVFVATGGTTSQPQAKEDAQVAAAVQEQREAVLGQENDSAQEEADERVSPAIAQRVSDAVLATSPDARILNVEKNEGGGYEVEMSDNTEVLVNEKFQVIGIERE